MSTNIQDYVEILNAEQHVQVDKLKEYARHGITPKVRGEVWMYLLGVLIPDRTSEITSIISMNTAYNSIPSRLPSNLESNLTRTALKHHTRRFWSPTYAGLISNLTSETTGPAVSAVQNRHHFVGQVGTIASTDGVDGRSDAQSHSGGSDGSSRRMASGASNDYRRLGETDTAMANNGLGRIRDPSISARSPPPDLLMDMGTGSMNGSPMRTENDGTTTLRSQVSRFLPPAPTAPPTRQGYLQVMMEALGKYFNSQTVLGRDRDARFARTGVENSEEDWVYLLTPFVCCLTRPVPIYLGFEKLVERMDTFPPLSSQLGTILTLFRLAIPDLFSYFEDEQVPYVAVTMSWMRTLLAREMWLGDVLRLWDAYFASEDMFALHCYVCVAVLATCKETLEELDGSEAKLMLLDLPPMDVDRLLQDAATLRVSYPLPQPVEPDPA